MIITSKSQPQKRDNEIEGVAKKSCAITPEMRLISKPDSLYGEFKNKAINNYDRIDGKLPRTFQPFVFPREGDKVLNKHFREVRYTRANNICEECGNHEKGKGII